MIDTTSLERAGAYLSEAAKHDNADEAVALLMGHAGIQTGDVAGVFFSAFDDLDAHWAEISQAEREALLSNYLAAERAYLPA